MTYVSEEWFEARSPVLDSLDLSAYAPISTLTLAESIETGVLSFAGLRRCYERRWVLSQPQSIPHDLFEPRYAEDSISYLREYAGYDPPPLPLWHTLATIALDVHRTSQEQIRAIEFVFRMCDCPPELLPFSLFFNVPANAGDISHERMRALRSYLDAFPRPD